MAVTTTIAPGPRSTQLDGLTEAIESHPIWTELRGPVNIYSRWNDVEGTAKRQEFIQFLSGLEFLGIFHVDHIHEQSRYRVTEYRRCHNNAWQYTRVYNTIEYRLKVTYAYAVFFHETYTTPFETLI